MGIGTDNNLSGRGMPLLHYDLVADSFANVRDDTALLPGKVPQEQVVVGQVAAGTGRSVVDKNSRPRRVGQPGQSASDTYVLLRFAMTGRAERDQVVEAVGACNS
jgi:hypothetical protein